MTILIDMDDVLEQLVLGWVDYLNDKYGTSTRYEDVTEWDFAVSFPSLTASQVYDAVLDNHLWDYVTVMPGGPFYVKRLIDDGHEVYVTTATDYETLKYKMEHVLFRYYPFISWDHVIITKNKHLVKGDVLIDDAPQNLVGGDYKKILFTACHNKRLDAASIGAVRVNNWKEAYEEISRLAEEMK